MVAWASSGKRPNIHFLESRGAGHRATGEPGQSDADNGLPLSSSATASPEYAPQPSLVFPPSPTTEVLGYQRGAIGTSTPPSWLVSGLQLPSDALSETGGQVSDSDTSPSVP